jgi:hypothetical protein
MLLTRRLIRLKHSNLLRIHVLGDLIRLPLLECEPKALMTVILVICLIFMVLDEDEVAVHGFWVEGEGDEGVDRGGLGNDLEGPGLEFVSRSRRR